MKKTFLSLAFVLSISISASFAAESKPSESNSKIESVKPNWSLQSSSKTAEKVATEYVVVHYSSCGTVNVVFWGETLPSNEEMLAEAEEFEAADCG